MLDRLVRPLVRTQIQLLAQTQSASARLMGMISQWLGYLGIQADVTYLRSHQGKVQIALAVGKPDLCSEDEWQCILTNISANHTGEVPATELTYEQMQPAQQSKVHRLLAYVIQAGNPHQAQAWDSLHPQLVALGLNASMLLGIRSALKVPALLESLLEDLEPEVAAFILSRAINVALIDRQITQDEDNALKAIYRVLENKSKV